MVIPKARPKMQNRIPHKRRLWPFTPRKFTCERSGSLRLASPPAASWARAAEAPARNVTSAAQDARKPARRGREVFSSTETHECLIPISDPPGCIQSEIAGTLDLYFRPPESGHTRKPALRK